MTNTSENGSVLFKIMCYIFLRKEKRKFEKEKKKQRKHLEHEEFETKKLKLVVNPEDLATVSLKFRPSDAAYVQDGDRFLKVGSRTHRLVIFVIFISLIHYFKIVFVRATKNCTSRSV